MHQPTLTKTHLMLGGMGVHIHQRRIQFKVEYIGRVPTMIEHILVGLAHRMGHQLVTDHAAIHEEVLHIRL